MLVRWLEVAFWLFGVHFKSCFILDSEWANRGRLFLGSCVVEEEYIDTGFVV